MTPEQSQMLRSPFPPETIGKLPKGGTMLDYVGHAAVTDRLLAVDPGWQWEPVAFADDGAPLIRFRGDEASLWIRLTIGDVTRLGVGTAKSSAWDLEKQLIGDALRNAAMRFGVALDLWSKEDLHAEPEMPPDTGGFASADEWRATVARLKTAVRAADEGHAPGIAQWVADAKLGWPWRRGACDIVRAELEHRLPAGADGGHASKAEVHPGAKYQRDRDADIAEYGDEPFGEPS